MKIQKVFTPNFYKKFKCTGSDCMNHCCHGWHIYIDKKTHVRYVNSSDSEIRDLAKDSLIVTRQGKKKYSIVNFNEKGHCPFLTTDKLCRIHQKMGGDALSGICATYPRIDNNWDGQLRQNMSMACSEVVKLVLFDPDNMLQHESINLLATRTTHIAPTTRTLKQENQLIHLFAWNLIAAKSDNIENNLLALGQFIIYLHRIDFDLHGRLSDVEAFYEGLITALESGQLVNNYGGSEKAILLKVQTLTAIFKDDVDKAVRNNSLQHVYDSIIKYLDAAEFSPIAEVQGKFSAINQQWQKLCTSSCLAEPHVIRNFLLYQLYTDYFPGKNLYSSMRQFYRIVIDYFILKCSFAVKSLQQEINQEDVVRLFADYYQYIYHSARMMDKVDNDIDKINGGDDLSCLLLLG